jgi:glycerol-3-phosphate dehydrogenase (NAD(P)+)
LAERLPANAPPLLVVAKGVEQATLKLPLEVLEGLRPGHPAGAASAQPNLHTGPGHHI